MSFPAPLPSSSTFLLSPMWEILQYGLFLLCRTIWELWKIPQVLRWFWTLWRMEGVEPTQVPFIDKLRNMRDQRIFVYGKSPVKFVQKVKKSVLLYQWQKTDWSWWRRVIHDLKKIKQHRWGYHSWRGLQRQWKLTEHLQGYEEQHGSKRVFPHSQNQLKGFWWVQKV